MVEHLVVAQEVVGSNPTSHPFYKNDECRMMNDELGKIHYSSLRIHHFYFSSKYTYSSSNCQVGMASNSTSTRGLVGAMRFIR